MLHFQALDLGLMLPIGGLLARGIGPFSEVELRSLQARQVLLPVEVAPFQRLSHRLAPFGMMLRDPSRIPLRPPVDVAPAMRAVVIAQPFGMMGPRPARIVVIPPAIGTP